MNCRRCKKPIKVELIESNNGYYMGYSCRKCHNLVKLTKMHPTKAAAKKAWGSR